MKSRKEKWFSNIYLHRWADNKYFGKSSIQNEKLYLRDKLGLVETTSLLKKEEITPKLGGSTDVLLIYGINFSTRKMVQD